MSVWSSECSTQEGDTFLASQFWAVEPPKTRDAPVWSCDSRSSGRWVVSDAFKFEDWRFLDPRLLNYWPTSRAHARLMNWIRATIMNKIRIRTSSIPMVDLLWTLRRLPFSENRNNLHCLDISAGLLEFRQHGSQKTDLLDVVTPVIFQKILESDSWGWQGSEKLNWSEPWNLLDGSWFGKFNHDDDWGIIRGWWLHLAIPSLPLSTLSTKPVTER